ncbi:MAG: hypothetical protein KC652_22825 [Cyanobacteria bacterium HKST-UBA01]|nr:hypothetical protein [Cyanobacteria bacterium HKST-UBA01]
MANGNQAFEPFQKGDAADAHAHTGGDGGGLKAANEAYDSMKTASKDRPQGSADDKAGGDKDLPFNTGDLYAANSGDNRNARVDDRADQGAKEKSIADMTPEERIARVRERQAQHRAEQAANDIGRRVGVGEVGTIGKEVNKAGEVIKGEGTTEEKAGQLGEQAWKVLGNTQKGREVLRQLPGGLGRIFRPTGDHQNDPYKNNPRRKN